MEYKRLTKKGKNGFYHYNCTKKEQKDCCLWESCGECYGSKVLRNLGELEDKIEQGTLKEEKTCVYDECNDGDWHYWECSNCGDAFNFSNEFTPEENHYYYCPNCGARITEYRELQE